jgi:glutaredoxin-like protein NrdH
MNVTVYSTTHCPECNVLKRFLRDYQIEFDVRDCSTNPAYWHEVKEFGFLGVPVTLINGSPIQGFKPEEIMKALGKM